MTTPNAAPASAEGIPQAERIVRRLVENTVRCLYMRWDLHAIYEAGDGILDEQEMVDDALALALGNDTGCLAEEEINAEHIDLLFVQSELSRLSQVNEQLAEAQDEVELKTIAVKGMRESMARLSKVNERLVKVLQRVRTWAANNGHRRTADQIDAAIAEATKEKEGAKNESF